MKHPDRSVPNVTFRCPACYGPLPGYTLLVGLLRLSSRAYKRGYHHGFRDRGKPKQKGKGPKDIRAWLDDQESIWFEPAPTDTNPRRRLLLEFLAELALSDHERLVVEHLVVLDAQRRRRDGRRWDHTPPPVLDWSPEIVEELYLKPGPPIRRSKFYKSTRKKKGPR